MNRLKGKFEGWTIDELKGLITDSAGNEYTSDEVRALFYFRQWRNEFEGSNGRILSLKEHLEKKLIQVREPVVTINWTGQVTNVKRSGIVS